MREVIATAKYALFITRHHEYLFTWEKRTTRDLGTLSYLHSDQNTAGNSQSPPRIAKEVPVFTPAPPRITKEVPVFTPAERRRTEKRHSSYEQEAQDSTLPPPRLERS
eukprot:644674-Rhodomonas_salina.1